MARQILPIVGAAVDVYLGGNGQVGYAIGSVTGESVHSTASIIKDPEDELDNRQRNAKQN